MASRALTFFGLDSSGPAPQPQPGVCKVTVTTNAWNTGLTASVTITDTGTTTINGWGATYTPASGAVTATNASYDGTLAPNASVTIGYRASHTGNSAAPGAHTLNGTTCTAA
jgi:cellulase/cellobiase CelA1